MTAPEVLPAETPRRPPEPALVRGGLMLVVGLIAYIAGKQIDTEWVEVATQVYALVISPALAAYSIRRVVSPTREYVAKHRRAE